MIEFIGLGLHSGNDKQHTKKGIKHVVHVSKKG